MFEVQNGLASVQYLQFSFLAKSFSGKFVQFSSGHGGQVPSFSSVHSLPALARSDLAGSARLGSARLCSGLVQSIESPTVWEEQRSSSGFHTAEIPARRSGVCRLVGWMMCFAGCACLLVRGAMWCRRDAISVQNCSHRVRSIQFACLTGLTASSFTSVRSRGLSVSVQFVQFSSFSSVHELFRS